jgi:general secretion pathway protein G
MTASAGNNRNPQPDGLEHNSGGLFRRRPAAPHASGFTLIELMIVMTIIVILISMVAPTYKYSLIRSREAVLRDDLFTLRSLIDQYTLDKQAAPQALHDLVDAGYLRDLPVDPFTSSSETWVEDFEDATVMLPTQTAPGIVNVHSGSSLMSLAGEPYSSW